MGLGCCKVGANENCGLFSPGALSVKFAKLHKKQRLFLCREASLCRVPLPELSTKVQGRLASAETGFTS